MILGADRTNPKTVICASWSNYTDMDEIVLDKKTFEALAMDSRVKILKALRERRKTQSELSKQLALAPSTVSEHLEKMLDAGLISKKKDHHKWIYYELTEKGHHILSPTKASVFVFALSVSLIMIAFGYFFLSSTAGSFSAAPAPAGQQVLGAEKAATEAVEPVELNYLAVIVLIAGVLVLLLSLYYWARK